MWGSMASVDSPPSLRTVLLLLSKSASKQLIHGKTEKGKEG